MAIEGIRNKVEHIDILRYPLLQDPQKNNNIIGMECNEGPCEGGEQTSGRMMRCRKIRIMSD